jgi:hypothetical protein
MARRKAFGDNPFGSGGGTSPPSTRPNGPGPNPDNAFDASGGGNNRQRRRRNRNPNRGNTTPGGGNGDNPFTPPDDGSGDNAASDLAFQDADFYKQGATGKLANTGVDFGAGTNQVPWLNDQIDQWITDYQGQELTNNPNLQWEDYLGQQFGAPPAPPTAPTNGDPQQRHRHGNGGGNGNGDAVTDPIVHAMGDQGNQRRRRRRRHGNGGGGGGGGDQPPPSPTPSVTPGLPPDTLARLTRNWEAASPTQRGYDSREYRAPKRTIIF